MNTFLKCKKYFEKNKNLKKIILVPFLILFYCLKSLPIFGKVFEDFLF
jgi:ABC-type polysaccharide transport system permease subunit